MKLNNLINIDKRKKFVISEATILSGKYIDVRRILLTEENGKTFVLANSIYDFHTYKKLIGKTVIAETSKTRLPKVITDKGLLEQVIGYLEEDYDDRTEK